MTPTDRIVYEPVKIDLHIHSVASAHKDGKKVKDGTVENIDTLVAKLEDNHVNMAAITDHDAFDYAVYDALRSNASGAKYLRKVLPGVEFTVAFATSEGDKPVHVITIFDDSDDKKVKGIESVLALKKGKPAYDKDNAFSEAKYWELIRAIGLDIVTIAHQKASPGSSRRRKDDANSVGEVLYNKFLFLEYFEAYEYKNRRNELFNKSYSYSRDQIDRLRFITGSDCHVWSAYPAYDEKTNPDMPYTYLKCLPTFRGLVMAITDISRIKTVPSFFSGSQKVLGSIDVSLHGTDISIPLSPGINAIIGDNSIGKSSILNALNDYRDVSPSVQRGQSAYLSRMGFLLKEAAPADFILHFDGQDSIRKSFEGLTDGKAKKQLDVHFPDQVDIRPFKSLAMGQFKLFRAALERSCKYQESISHLANYSIPHEPPLIAPQSITFNTSIDAGDSGPHSRLINSVKDIGIKIAGISSVHSDVILNEDLADLKIAREALGRIESRHEAIQRRITLEIKVANKVRESVSEQQKAQTQIVTDSQKEYANYRHNMESIAQSIADAVKREQQLQDFTFKFKTMKVQPNVNPVGDLQFVSKLVTEEVSPSLLHSLVAGLIGKRKTLNTLASSSDDVRDAINNYSDDNEDPLDVLQQRFEKALDKKLKPVKSIIREGDDVFDELSQGYDAQLYFKLMSDSGMGDGVYIVDQPEDQISQKAIRQTVLGEFREIAAARQVLLITHNPQFIVNLDVDNVIYIGHEQDGLCIKSGALEFECADYRILDIVADHIEGGLDTIRRRMKRYEKAS